jgi:hypothetical protein
MGNLLYKVLNLNLFKECETWFTSLLPQQYSYRSIRWVTLNNTKSFFCYNKLVLNFGLLKSLGLV